LKDYRFKFIRAWAFVRAELIKSFLEFINSDKFEVLGLQIDRPWWFGPVFFGINVNLIMIIGGFRSG
jgi:hypothetical protein